MAVKVATSLTTTLLLFTRGKTFAMYSLIQNTLGNTSFVYINKAVIKQYNINP